MSDKIIEFLKDVAFVVLLAAFFLLVGWIAGGYKL